MFRCAGQYKQAVFRSVEDVTSYYCYPALDRSVRVNDFMECAELCMLKLECFLFAYKNGQCTTTNLTPGSKAPFENITDWYSLKSHF